MSGFDQPGIFFTDAFNDVNLNTSTDIGGFESHSDILMRFKTFVREFQDLNNDFIYRDQLKRNKSIGQYFLVVKIEHLAIFDSELSDKLLKTPSEVIEIFEAAIALLSKEPAFKNTHLRIDSNKGDDTSLISDESYQIILTSDSTPCSIRNLKSEQVSKLVKVPGVVISASSIKARPTSISIQCRSCLTTIPNIKLKSGFDSFVMPRKCPSSQPRGLAGNLAVNPIGNQGQCPLDPFFVLPDKCKCVDSQIIKIQELHESAPPGEIPRHLTLLCNRFLVDKVTPGTRITVVGVYSIRKLPAAGSSKGSDKIDKSDVGLRKPYLRVVGIELDEFSRCIGINSKGQSSDIHHKSNTLIFSEEEELMFRDFANLPNTYEIIYKNIAPSIYGSDDIKKAIACLLFGGSRKKLPDGLIRRGDINVLLLGDPGTAKSQLLKFCEKVSPVGYYTSGKGSSAAGLTASLNRDPTGKGFVIEGGAMVLADGGVVCIDEFDKMREDDRVAIHEAMEQQTISIAKAGITTTLNSRCAVLAAANSVFGRWDDTKGQDNIEFMPTILSRFDMIFIVKDNYDKQRDMQLAKHVLQVHTNSLTSNTGSNPLFNSNIPHSSINNSVNKNELDITFLSRYISYCRQNCAPRVSADAANVLKHYYSEMRNRNKQYELKTGKKSTIYITVRQLEAIVRTAESLAKMKLLPFATEEHVEEAMRLFKSSTLDAAATGSLSGAEGFTNDENMQELRLIESQIKQRFAIGTQVSEQRIIQEFVKQRFSESAVMNVLNILLRRGDIQHRFQRKVLLRIK